MAQRFVESVLFYHPLVGWIGSKLEVERETSCDDWVVSRTGNPAEYVSSISRLIEVNLEMSSHRLTPGLAAKRSSLFERMKRVLDESVPSSSMISGEQVAVLGGIFLLLTVLVFAASPLIHLGFTFSDADEEGSSTAFQVPMVEVSGLAPLPALAPLPPLGPLPPLLPLPPLAPLAPLAPVPPLTPLAPLASSPEVDYPTAARLGQVNDLSLKSWIMLLDAVRLISSSGDKADVLVHSVGRLPREREALAAFLDAAATVSSSSDRSRTLVALVRGREMDERSYLMVIDAASKIFASSDKRSLLSVIIRKAPVTSLVSRSIDSAIRSVSNGNERDRLIPPFQRRFNN